MRLSTEAPITHPRGPLSRRTAGATGPWARPALRYLWPVNLDLHRDWHTDRIQMNAWMARSWQLCFKLRTWGCFTDETTNSTCLTIYRAVTKCCAISSKHLTTCASSPKWPYNVYSSANKIAQGLYTLLELSDRWCANLMTYETMRVANLLFLAASVPRLF